MSETPTAISRSPPPDELINGKLKLRRYKLADAEALHAAVSPSLPELSKWMPWAANGYSHTDAESFLRFTTAGWNDNKVYDYAIVFEDRICGSSGLMTKPHLPPDGLEIGYWLATDATGKGLVTLAADVLARTAFEMGYEFVEIRHDPANAKSEGVPKRLGYEYVGLRHTDLPGEQMTWHLHRPGTKASTE